MPTTKSAPPPAPMGAAAAHPKRYDEAFKRQAVENWLRSGPPGTQIARELGISCPALKDWKRRYDGDAAPTHPDLMPENRALKAELQRVREQRDIPKKSGDPLRNAPERYQPIQAIKPDHSLAAVCAAFDVTRSGYLAWEPRQPSLRAPADTPLQTTITSIPAAHRGRDGAPRIHAELRAPGQRHSRKRMARLLRRAGWRGLCARRFVPRTTDSRHARPIAPNPLPRPGPTQSGSPI